MGKTVKRGRSKTVSPSKKPDTSDEEGLWGPLPPERYDFKTRGLLWLLALAVMVLLSIYFYGV